VKKFAIALILCLSAVNGFSQCRTNRVSIRKETHDASAVLVGTVIAAQPAPEAWDFLDGVNYTVRVDSKIHGNARPNSEVTIFSENSSRFFPMYVGQQYVLYLQPTYDRYQVDNCGNSHPTDENMSSASTKQQKPVASRGF
jgi:hypothetical protein